MSAVVSSSCYLLVSCLVGGLDHGTCRRRPIVGEYFGGEPRAQGGLGDVCRRLPPYQVGVHSKTPRGSGLWRPSPRSRDKKGECRRRPLVGGHSGRKAWAQGGLGNVRHRLPRCQEGGAGRTLDKGPSENVVCQVVSQQDCKTTSRIVSRESSE